MCPTRHRHARTVRVALLADPYKQGETVVVQWAWCPDCAGMLKRRAVIRHMGDWRRPEPGDDVPERSEMTA